MAVALDPPALRTPGLKPVDPAWESYCVRPGAATVVAVRPDDRVTVVDLDGGQPAELTVLGRERARRLRRAGRGGDAPATVLRGLLANGAGDVFLASRHAAGSTARTRGACGCSARTRRRAGARRSAPTARRGRRRRAGRPVVDGASAGVRADRGGRPRGARGARRARAPARRWPSRGSTSASTRRPRSPTRSGRRVHPDHRRRAAGSARTSSPSTRASSSAGVERGLDAAGHAHADGHAYPRPACTRSSSTTTWSRSSRSCRDTVGRHDTFALACTARYYEDQGYPGHVNCSENFNRAARPVRDPVAQGLAGDQLLLQHRVRRPNLVLRRRALVAPRRLRAAAGDDRPGLRLVRLPRRHRPGQRLGSDRHPRPRLPRRRTASRRRSPTA